MFTDGKCELESSMKVESIIDVLAFQIMATVVRCQLRRHCGPYAYLVFQLSHRVLRALKKGI